MGNKIARTTQVSASEYYLHDLPSSYNLVLKEVLGRGRFVKSILCKHDEGLVLVKVYFKRGDFIDLREYERHLGHIKDIFRSLDHPHVWPFQFWQETDKAAYLVRQFFFNNLHDRLGTRPFLSFVEKKWLAFQLLLAVKQCHEKGICHGDIKCENVLVTSWNWLYLVDFASFKPTYIPHDDPSDFSFFFDTGGRRLCYLAPERFYEHGGEMQVAQDAPLKPSMDIFAVGCVIAELFLERQPLFELSQLLAYRRGQYDPCQHLEKIPDTEIRKMILHMIQLEPEARLTADSYMESFAVSVFPSYFAPFLHNLYCCWNPLHSDMRVAMCQSVFSEILKQMISKRTEQRQTISEPQISASLSGSSISSFFGDANQWREDSDNPNLFQKATFGSAFSQGIYYSDMQSPEELFHTVSIAFRRRSDHPFLKTISVDNLSSCTLEYDSELDAFGIPFLPFPEDGTAREEGLVLIASLLCSCVRNIRLPHLRRGAVLLLRSCSLYIDDEDRLQRVLPYVVAMLSDPAAIVRCAAIETLCDMLPLVREFPPTDAKIFPEYLLPMLSMLPDDPEESVRICYASNIAKLALTAYGFLIYATKSNKAGSNGEFDLQLGKLRKCFADVIQELAMGSKQTPGVRRALLEHVGSLCYFFGRRQSNDFLLPILPAFLNDRDDQLRALFYSKITCVCFFVGQTSVEEYLLPYIQQALTDQNVAVIANALDCLVVLCEQGLLRKRVLLQTIDCSLPLLCYPSQWIRRSAVAFIAASSSSLGMVDSYVFLQPAVRPFLCRNPESLSSHRSILFCLKKPCVSRQTFYRAMENPTRSDVFPEQSKNLEFFNHGGDEKSSQGIPLYSFSVDSQAVKFPHLGSDSSSSRINPTLGISSSLLPWMDSANINRSFSLGCSVPPQVLLSGSCGTYTGSKQFYRVVHEPESREVEQSVRNFHEDASRPDELIGKTSPGWRPRGVLIAHMQEHRAAVNDIAVSSDESFFVSASDDSTVKVWDSRRLERDISFRSRLTYHLEGSRGLCAVLLQNSAQVVVGACDGLLHMFSVDHGCRSIGKAAAKYSGITDIKKKDVREGAILSLLNYPSDSGGGEMVLYGTQNCGIHLFDTRADSNPWNLKAVPEEGYISCLVLGSCGNWFASGSSRGVLTLWDLRFLLPVNTCHFSLESPIEDACLFVPHPTAAVSSAANPLIYVAAGFNEVSLWNAGSGRCHQVFRMANLESHGGSPNVPRVLTRPTGKVKFETRRNAIQRYRVEELKEPPPRLPGVRSLLPLPGGDLLTGSTDLKIRRWDHSSPNRSYCVCGPNLNGAEGDNLYEQKSSFEVKVVQETIRSPVPAKFSSKSIFASAVTDSAGCHRDSILSLATVKLNHRLLISSSRDGAIKVWK